MSSTSSGLLQAPFPVGKKITPWDLFAVLMFLIFGIAAIIDPVAASMRVTLVMGWLLIFGGIISLIKVFKGNKAIQIIFHILITLLCVIAGVYCVTHPTLAMGALTFPYRKCLAWSRQ